MLSHQDVGIQTLAEVFPEHFTSVAEDLSLAKRVEIEGMCGSSSV